MRAKIALYVVVVCLCSATILSAQDAVKTDAKHYSVITENEQVRVLKIHYGPHEKSVMHSHPNTVVVFLTDANVQFSFPDGRKETHAVKAGDSQYSAAGTHLPENMGDKAMDAVLIELKSKTAKVAAPTKVEPVKAAKK